MIDALFHRDGETFVPTELSGSPWSPTLLHGGPPTGLLAYVLSELAPGLELARLSVDLLRPVPRAPLRASAAVVRAGRRLQVVTGALHADGVEVCRATALFLEQRSTDVPEYAGFAAGTPPFPEHAPRGSLSDVAGWSGKQDTLPGLHTTAEACLVDGVAGRGMGTVWMRLPVPLIEGVPVTPTIQAATLADFGNGVGQLRLGQSTGCINADVTLYLHRAPVAGWLAIEARSRMEPHGVGLVETHLYDERGPVGRVVQATLAMPVYQKPRQPADAGELTN